MQAEDKKIKLFQNKEYLSEMPDFNKSFVIIDSIIKSKETIPLIDLYDQVMGVKVYQNGKGKPKQTNFEIDNDVFISKVQTDKFSYPFVSQGIKRYFYENQSEFINYGQWLAEPRSLEFFNNPKIVIREIINPTIFATYLEEDAVVKNIAAVITSKNSDFPLKYLLAILNSKLINFYVNEQSPKSNNKSYPSFNSRLLKNIPLIDCDLILKNSFIEKADQMLSLTKTLQENSAKFQRTCERKFEDLNLTKKMQDWYNLSYADFIKELTKQKINLSLSQEAEWADYFDQEKSTALEIQSKIASTDKEIDQLVYELYGLSEEEIKIVEEY